MTVNTGIYPWHRLVLEHVQSQVRDSRLPHGLLFRHRPYYFDEVLGWEMARILLCDTNGGQDNCQHCRMINERTHPNVLFLDIFDNPNQKPKERIGINQIRVLEQQMWQTSVFDKPKVAFISGMDLLSLGAQNALLKTLEEPPNNAFFIISVKNISQVLPTIMSRIQQIRHEKLALDVLLQWLRCQVGCTSITEVEIAVVAKLANNAPEQSLQLLRDPDAVKKLIDEKKRFAQFLAGKVYASMLVAKMDKEGIEEQLTRYQRYTESIIHFLFARQVKKTEDDTEKITWNGISLPQFYQLLDEIMRLRQLARTNVDMSWQLNTGLSAWQNQLMSLCN